MTLSNELREKIRRRAARAWGETTTKIHRITNVTEKTLMYRISGGNGMRNGPTILVKRDKLGRIYVPKEVDG